MNKNIRIFSMTVMAAAIALFSSCSKDRQDIDWSLYYPNALVTVKPLDAEGSSFYMQLDDKTTLFPVNVKKSPYAGKEVRAFVNYSKSDESAEGYDYAVKINWIDSIRTKDLVPLTEDISKDYGSDPVEILKAWTVVEDGYFSINFSTFSSGRGARHDVNLVYVGDPDATTDEEKYVVEFKHNANGDTYGYQTEGYVAFWLNGTDTIEGLPDTGGETVKLTLRWDSYSGRKSAEFDYCTRVVGAASDGDSTEEGTEGN